MPALPTTSQIDPRGPRFGAAITSVLLIAVLLLAGLSWATALVLLVIQTLAFAAGSLLGLKYQPWGWVFKTFVRPRLAAPAELEEEAPPRFSQTVGLAFALIGLLGLLAGFWVIFYVAIGFALVAALLNSVFDFCLGCEIYLLTRRLFRHTAAEGGA